MKFEVSQQVLLKPLRMISGVVERRHTLAVLANVLLEVDNEGLLQITGTDQEVELSEKIAVSNFEVGEITVPARKLFDICRSIDPEEMLTCQQDGSRLLLTSGRFKSHLSTLPATEFPKVELSEDSLQFSMQANILKKLLGQTAFAMAQQDVRYFFNGLLLELESEKLQAVATNGQRLARNSSLVEINLKHKQQVIIPRKGVVELVRILQEDSEAEVHISLNHLVVKVGECSLTSKLVDATYPDYERAIPAAGNIVFQANKQELREALSRTSILTNEMYRSIHLTLSEGSLNLKANNPQQEEAEETIAVDYQGEELQIAFNVGYLLDALSVIEGPVVEVSLSDAKQAAVLRAPDDKTSTFVVSPMVL